MYLPEMPVHIIQRGNDRQACYYSKDDYQFYLDCLAHACARYGVKLHAYVLMTNHVHLLMTPVVADAVSRVMQSLGRRYVRRVNSRYGRTGTLWESRHQSSLVDADDYLLACYRYIELNPVRAGMVINPGDYPWSSYRHNAYGERTPWLTPHECYLQLGTGLEQRCRNYRGLFVNGLDAADVRAIRNAAAFGMPLGNDRFKAQVERILGQAIGHARRGRPPARKQQDRGKRE